MNDQWKFLPTTVGLSDNSLQNLVVVTCISNPVRFKSRYALYKRFADAMTKAGVRLITVEQGLGERPFEITERDHILHLQVRTEDELWHKENMINLGFNYALQIFPDARYFASVDADVLPMGGADAVRPWLEETVQMLQHHHVVQMFETAIDLGPDDQMVGQPVTSFMARYIQSGYEMPQRGGYWSENDYHELHGHPGYAWAYTKHALDNMSSPLGGPLIEHAILGAGDRHMALGLVGCMEQSFEHLNDAYRSTLMQWQMRCERWIKRDVGYVKRSLYHYWHGKKRDRGYTDRWKILRDNNYDPMTDLTRDAQGLLKLETWDDRQIRLRDQIRSYLRSRNEDSIDL